MHDKCKQCTNKGRTDGKFKELNTGIGYGCGSPDCFDYNGFPEFEPIKSCANCGWNLNRNHKKYAHCGVDGYFDAQKCGGWGNAPGTFEKWKPIDESPEKPELVKCRDCKHVKNIRPSTDSQKTVSGYGDYTCECIVRVYSRSLTLDRGCTKFEKREEEKPKLVRCVGCQHARDIHINGGVYFCKCSKENNDEERYLSEDRECNGFVKKEPVLVKCVNCQHARDIRGDMEVYTCICTPDPPEMVGERHLLGHDRECPSFVEKTCDGCKYHTCIYTDEHGTRLSCNAGYSKELRDKLGLDRLVCGTGELGRYAWEPIIPEKEKEKQIEWLWVAPCTDCDFWKERPLSTSEIICGMGVTIKCTHDGYNQSERPCKWYKQKEPFCNTCARGDITCFLHQPLKAWGCDSHIPRSCGNCGNENGPRCSPAYEFVSCRNWEPRSCENCGLYTPNILCRCGANNGAGDMSECKYGTWRSWTPRVEKKPVFSTHFYCEGCGNRVHVDIPEDYSCVVVPRLCDECIEKQEKINEVTEMNYDINTGERFNKVLEMNEKNEEHVHVYGLRSNKCECGKKVDFINDKQPIRFKSEEKFPFTCPSCGTGDDQRENYCAHCGHEFIRENLIGVVPYKFNEQGIKDAHHVPEKRERTRKAVRVRDKISLGFAIGGLVIFTILRIATLFVGYWNAPTGYSLLVVSISGLVLSLKLMDVPRIPALDRLRAWRHDRKARKDGRLAARLHVATKDREFYKDRYSKLGKRAEELREKVIRQDARIAELERMLDAAKNDVENAEVVIEEKDAEIAAHLKDRDENWIPRSNQLYIYSPKLELIGTKVLYNKILMEFTESKGGPIARAIVDGKRDDILLFSADVINNKDGEE